MTQAQLDHEVADATGESLRTVHRLGFSVLPDDPVGRDPDPLYLVIDCPLCRQPTFYPGQLAGVQSSLDSMLVERPRRRILRQAIAPGEA